MDQVSRPMLVVLAAVVILAGAWFTVLRPKANDGGSSSPAPAAQAPGVKGLTSAVAKAKGAVSQSQASAQRVERAAGNETAAKPSTSSASAKPAVKPAAVAKASKPAAKVSTGDPSAPLLAKAGSGRTVVVLFMNPKGSDDLAVRAAVRSMHGDRNVTTAVVPIARVGDYQAITTGVQVLTAPTVLVIGKDRKAKTITGLTDATELRQLVVDIRKGR